MTNVIGLIILLILITQLVISLFLLAHGIKLYRNFHKFVLPIGPDQPSPLGVVVSSVSDKIAGKIHAAILGIFSGQSRVEKAAEGELVEAGLNEVNPLCGVLAAQFPKLRKLLVKNPELAQIALSKIGGLKMKSPESSGNGKPWTGSFGG